MSRIQVIRIRKGDRVERFLFIPEQVRRAIRETIPATANNPKAPIRNAKDD